MSGSNKLKAALKCAWWLAVGAFALIGLSVTAVSGWAVWQYVSTSSKELRGEQAAAEIRRWFEGTEPVISEARAYYARNGIPADPSFFCRFIAPDETVGRLVSQYSLKKRTPDARDVSEGIERFQKLYRGRELWWRPVLSPEVVCYYGDRDGNFFYLFHSETTGLCHLYIQNT